MAVADPALDTTRLHAASARFVGAQLHECGGGWIGVFQPANVRSARYAYTRHPNPTAAALLAQRLNLPGRIVK